MGKSKKSMLNAITALLQTFVVGIVGLVMSKSVLDLFGSDVNGINSTIIQLVNTIMLLEGGFTVASNVALFQPFANNDTKKISGIVSATGKKFKKIGILTVLCSLALAVVYPLMVHSVLLYWEIFFLILSVALPTCFNMGLITKYRVLILATQKEYIISFIYTIFYMIGNIIAILLINNGYSLLAGRVAIMVALFLNYVFIAVYCKKEFAWVNYKESPMHNEIKGTKSVISLKVMSFFYTSAPMLMISTIPETGLLLASVYSVYKNVITMVKNVLTAVSNAPRLSFGALLAEGNIDKIKQYFRMYEMIVCIMEAVILGVTSLLILPFVQLYTDGVSDISYNNIPLAILLIVTTLLELLHIPSGQIIQMKGDFRIANKIQTSALVVLIITMFFGRTFGGIIGIVSSVLVAASILAILEIGYVAKKILYRANSELLKNIFPCILMVVICMIIGINVEITIKSYLQFVFYGLVFSAFVGSITLLIYAIIDYKMIKNIFKFAIGILGKNRNKLGNI